MTLDQNKTLVRRYYEDVFNSGDISRLEDFVSPDYTEIYNQKVDTVGIDGAREHILGVRKTYPDIQLKVNRQIAEGDWVVTEVHMQGTQLGDWLGIHPTGKRISVTAVNMDKVLDGLIAVHTGAANLLEPLLDIGAVQVTAQDRE